VVGAALRWVDARFLACGAGAVALHALALLATDSSTGVRSLATGPDSDAFFEVGVLSGEGGDPGGGSAAAVATAAIDLPAPQQPRASVRRSAMVPRSTTPRARAPHTPRPAPVRPPRDALLASAFGAESFLSQVLPLRASMRDLLERAEPHADEPLTHAGTMARSLGSASSSPASLSSASLSTGAGVRGGRGGPGAGSGAGGRVSGDFAFGGSSGAQRAELCFIPPGTRRLRELPHCSGGAVFFADELNVASRRFEDGFPGVSARNEWFSLRYTGSFRIERGGEYRFRLKSDDGSQLFIDDELVIDLDGVHDAVSKRGAIELERGLHTIAVRYFQGPRYTIALQLFVTPPGQSERIFRPEL
jgi:fibro-slime domain-containing protein